MSKKTEIPTIPTDSELISVLASSLYPGAALESIRMVLDYCRAAGLDPMQKPVHITSMYDSKLRQTRDVIMPGIGLYRTQAARTGSFAGMSEPEFGPDVPEEFAEESFYNKYEKKQETRPAFTLTYPVWCRVTVKRLLANGMVAEFPAVERWKENYATAKNSLQPNAMWRKRAYGQLAKCAEAQALRKGFPEIGAAPTAEEMHGKTINDDDGMTIDGETGEISGQKPTVALPQRRVPKAETFDEIQRAEDAPEDDEPEQKKPATKKPQAEPQSGTSVMCTPGEVNHIAMLLKRGGVDLDATCEAANLSRRGNLDGLTKDEWIALKDELK